MDDAELNAIRAARLQELQKNAGQSPSSSPQSQQQSGLNAALDQVLEPEAKARLSRVNLVKPERARAVEQYIMKLAQTGQIRRKLSEDDIVEILDGIARDEQQRNKTSIVFSRKQSAFDDEDDEDDFFD